jgi:hypothetical protein
MSMGSVYTHATPMPGSWPCPDSPCMHSQLVKTVMLSSHDHNLTQVTWSLGGHQ